MPAKIIVFCTPKGGAGKTTLAINIAATLRGKVLLLDADPQQSALKWANVAPDDSPLPMVVMGYTGDKIHRELQKVVDQYQYIIIDTPPSALAVASATRSALIAADLVLVPVIPSPVDIWEAMTTAALLAEINDIRESGQLPPLQARLLINKLKARTTFGAQINAALTQVGIPILNTAIREREAHKHAALDGCSVHKVKTSGAKPAAAEISQLTREIRHIV